ncbi:DUF1513 domain-containing protein [Stappia sp.]|uniref:DUF1513 domain-containing protein n=1 Tax=Stappia sp. TaxID=1870903 RepID=UPI0032D94A28
MRSTATERALDRRQVLTGAAATALALVLPGAARGQAGAGPSLQDDPLFVAARRQADGSHAVVVTGLDGLDRQVIPLPARGHDVAQCPVSGRCLAFARRPGTFAVLFDPAGRRPPETIQAVAGRHFYGHGAFSPDGRLAYATENDYAAARGVIGVYDVSGETVRRIGEFDSGGTGPHDLLPMPDGRRLVVANGGIETHPERGREKLNIATMRPNVSLIDRESGEIVARVEAPAVLHKLSLRHMAVTDAGRVWIGGQHQGGAEETPPLMASFDATRERLTFHDVPADLSGRLANYVGSVSASHDGTVIAASCPRAGRVLYFAGGDGRFLGSQQRADACGVAPLDRTGFLLSDGSGALLESTGPQTRPLLVAARPGVAWDNHLVAVRPVTDG